MMKRIVKVLKSHFRSESYRSYLKWYQDYALRKTLRYASRYSPFYQRKFAEAGLSPDIVKKQEDLPKLGFFTTGADIQSNPYDFLTVPEHEIACTMATAGTTGRSKQTFYTQQDREKIVWKIELGFVLMDIGKEEVGQVMFCSGTPNWMGGSLLQEAMQRHGCTVLAMGNAPSPKEQLQAMVKSGTTYVFSTPSYLHRVTEEGKQIMDLASLGVKAIYLGAEPSSKAFRDYLQEAWHTKVYDGYGMMEMGAGVAGECPVQDGLHLDLFLVAEVVAPDTGEPLGVGEEGELVFTTLGRKATPLIRYRSGDIARLLPDEPCPCGLLPTRKISNILGRTDDLLFLGTGENFYPAQLDKAMVAVPGVAGYQMIVGGEGYKDTLLLRIETALPSPELAERVKDSLYREIPFIPHDIFESQTIDEPVIEFLNPGTLQGQNPIKVRKVIDRRSKV